MISEHEMMSAILDACPTFRPEWQRFLDEWRDEEELPLYVSLADFSVHVINMLARGETDGFPDIFDAIERLTVEGDSSVRTAAIIGILEILQNPGLHSTTEPEQFRPFLRTQSERWWDKLYDFWERGKILNDD